MAEQILERTHSESRDKLLTAEDVASVLDIHVDAVNTLVNMKLLPQLTISPRFERRFREDDVRFLALK